MRPLQIPLLFAEHAVDVPTHFPRLPLGLALLRAQLVRATPPLLLRVGFGPRASRALAGAPRGWGPGRVFPSHRGRGWAGPHALRGRLRGRARGVLWVPEEQRSQTVAQTHVGAARARGLLTRGSGRSSGSEAGGGCAWTQGRSAAGPGQGPRPLTAQKGHFAFSAGRKGWWPPGLEIT